MAQNYLPLQPTDSLQASRIILNNNDAAMISNFSGTAFPTLNLFEGMQCYRTDSSIMYTLRTLSPVTWVLSQKLLEVAISRTDADYRYHRFDTIGNGNLYLGGAGPGVNDAASIGFYANGSSTPAFMLTKDSSQNLLLNRYNSSGVYQDTPIGVSATGTLTSKGYQVWHSGNDGTGSGLDADLVDGVQPTSLGLSMLSAANAAEVLSLIGLTNGLGDPGDLKIRYSWNETITGWVLCNGLTIGNVGSGATARAAADCQNLFTHLWNTNTGLAVSGGRGASAAADWAAGKNIATPDARGRALFGRDGMGNSAVGRLLNSIMAYGNTDYLGGYGGASVVSLAYGEMPNHSHNGYTDYQGDHYHSANNGLPFQTAGGGSNYLDYLGGSYTSYVTTYTNSAGSHQHNVYTYAAGSGTAHQNMPPFLLVSIYIKL